MDLGWLELHPARLQRLERHPAIFHLDRIKHGPLLGLGGCAWPQNELEVLPLDADGQESRAVGCRGVKPLLEADDVRVEVERLVLIAHQQRHVHHLFQHRRCSRFRHSQPPWVGDRYYFYDNRDGQDVTRPARSARRSSRGPRARAGLSTRNPG